NCAAYLRLASNASNHQNLQSSTVLNASVELRRGGNTPPWNRVVIFILRAWGDCVKPVYGGKSNCVLSCRTIQRDAHATPANKCDPRPSRLRCPCPAQAACVSWRAFATGP